MRYIGIDYGSKRIGLAVGSDVDGLAFPREVLQNNKDTLPKIKEFIKDNNIDAIVIGESKNLDGIDNPIMRDINQFSEQIKKEINIPVFFESELYTSHQAQHIQGKNDMIDASAASLILGSFLERQKHNRGESDSHADIFDKIQDNN